MAENTKKTTVILPHRTIDNQIPTPEKALIGELFINGASGEGESFLATKKSNDEMAVFHEDSYWQKQVDESTTFELIDYETTSEDTVNFLDKGITNAMAVRFKNRIHLEPY